ncbi:type I-E CRISPR-associated endoribonuclease Cas2e [Streptomyces virginiae]|uniref:type I-E CRISPR-associated endoribonuclease Cas2e n=1 Tax=Streptomyces virginiae TaxID=1961 RepID=UPI0038111026
MPSLTVISATAVPDRLRGALTRWMLEVTPELYVGTISARVRDQLWSAVAASIGDGMAVLVHPSNNEQGFTLHTAGSRRRRSIDFDGLSLIAFQQQGKETANQL